MNKILRTAAFALAAPLLLAACSKLAGQSGSATLSLQGDWQVADITRSAVSDYTSIPSAQDFSIVVSDADGGETPVSDRTQPLKLAVGEYTAKAIYGSTAEEGFDKPCFAGEQSFVIIGGQTTDVLIRTSLANCMIKLVYTDSFRQYYSDWAFTLTSGSGNTIAFAKDETRAAFLDAYLVKVNGSLTTQGGAVRSFEEKEFRNLQPATCYTMKFDASNIGQNSISITFDDSVEEVLLDEVELND